MPTFGGSNIFGTAVSMVTVDNPRASQLNAYFGLSGLKSLDGGSRGRVTRVTGLISGNSPGSLATAESTFRSFNDGKLRTLVDTLGVSWLNVRLESYEPIGRIQQSLWGVLFRPYRARFFHVE